MVGGNLVGWKTHPVGKMGTAIADMERMYNLMVKYGWIDLFFLYISYHSLFQACVVLYLSILAQLSFLSKPLAKEVTFFFFVIFSIN